jgi:NADP-reducing hydrogenase subunit HndB
MTKLNREGLVQLRAQTRAAWQAQQAGPTAQIIIGMGTCGIAAGAAKAWAAFADELAKNNLTDVQLLQTGCMGLCYSEPTVEVRVPGMPPVIYGKVNAEVARRIVRKHIVGRLLINDHIYDRPAGDVFAKGMAAKT